MSHLLTHVTPVNDHELLKRTCDKLRREGVKVEGPHYVTGHRMRSGQTIDGYSVRLPEWHRDCVFPCDGSAVLDCDNWSPYFDNRSIDPATLERVPGTGTVHPDVLSGAKTPGQDGRWGDIEELHRLHREYVALGHEEVATERGDYITRVDSADGSYELEIQIAE